MSVIRSEQIDTGDSDFIEGQRWRGQRPVAARRDPAQMELFV